MVQSGVSEYCGVDMKNEYQFKIREYIKRWPRLYYGIVDIFGPIYFGGLGPKAFAQRYFQKGNHINLGSGGRVVHSTFINVDITKYPIVDIVSDITAVPLPDGHATMIVSDNVLEHVKSPDEAVKEIYRLLSPGGVAYINTPFLYPFHSSPGDYQRWTAEGLKKLFSEFTICEVGVRSGPFSVFTVQCVYLFAGLLSLGSKSIYKILVDVLIFVFFPIKYLDVLGNHFPFAIDYAASLYIVVKK